MADFDYFGADYGREDGPRLLGALRAFGLANWLGAATSVGLTAGLAVWAVDLTFRDVSTVPVILALEGPMRVQPEEPGGATAPFQGMALADITSGGTAAPAPERIVLAPPPAPLDAPALADRVAASGAAQAAPAADGTAPPEADAVDLAMLDAAAQTALAAVPAEGEPSSGLDFRDAIAAAVAAAQPEAAGTGLSISTRPTRRPAAALRLASRTPIEAPAQIAGVDVASIAPDDRSLTEAAMAAGREVDPASLVTGTRIVQLGAFESATVARAEWTRLEGRFADYMAGKRRLVEPARAGGRDFWRLRAVGFADGDEARRFCAALVARDAACIPVTVR